MVFYRIPTEFSLEILCTLITLALPVQGAHNAYTELSRSPHSAEGVLKTQ